MVEYLEYKDKQLPFKVSSYAMKGFYKEHKKPIEKMEDGNMQELETILFYSLESGFKEEGLVFDIKKEEVEWILDNCLWDFIEKMQNFFPKSDIDPDKKK